MSENNKDPVRLLAASVCLLAMFAIIGWFAGGLLIESPASFPVASEDLIGNEPYLPPGESKQTPLETPARQTKNAKPEAPVSERASKHEPPDAEKQLMSDGLVDLQVWISYADGVAFEGVAVIELGKSGDKTITFGKAQPVPLKGVDGSQGLEISLMSRRPGFVFDEFKLTALELSKSNEVHCIIPESGEPNGVITVDVTAFPAEEKLWVRVEHESGYTVMDSNTLTGGAKYTTGTLRVLRPDKYRVLVMGEQVWQSGWFELHAGEARVLTAEPQEPASAAATLVDENGQPVTNALLYRDTGLYYSESDLKIAVNSAREGFAASPDSDGAVRLTRLAPGRQILCVQGAGTEIVRSEVMLLPGQQYELGTIRLSPASGSVTVRLRGTVSPGDYRVEVLQPMGSPVVAPKEFEDGVATVERLPLRKYTVAVCIKATGRCYSSNIELSESHPNGDIEFDVSAPPPAPD